MPVPLLQISQPCVPRQFSQVLAGNYSRIQMFEKERGKVLKQSHLSCLTGMEQLMSSLLLEELTDESRKHQNPDYKKESEMGLQGGCSLKNLDKIGNLDKRKKRKFHEKGN